MTDTDTTETRSPEQLRTHASPLWAAARYSVAWLDRMNGVGRHETAMRLMKLVEEAGEVMEAYIGMVGQNPRKGITHKPKDVAAELCDVILTAAVALHRFADDPERFMAEHADRVVRRIEALGGDS
ncbi:MazG-like family protein [Streptomyces hygroscopicus]|uniref:MazG-like family protein n=1 Tax=Streptomyces hygroscopicus TaxID=1912 RepID=UPI0037B1B0F1